ncbi:MAG: amino acid adenylation domain-containing protein, partial [Acidobacteria bacterium]
ALAYWRRRLAPPLPQLELPADRPRRRLRQRGGVAPLDLDDELGEALRRAARRRRVSLFAYLLAAFATLLHRRSEAHDLIVGAPVAGREDEALDGLIGCFTTTLALRLDLSGDPSFERFLGRVRQTVLGALAHQQLPFVRLVRQLRADGAVGAQPLFRVMLVLNSSSGPPLFPGLEVASLAVDPGRARFDLTLGLDQGATHLDGWLEHDADRFDRTTIARFGRHLATLLQGAVERPGDRLSELPLLTAAERHQLLVEWGDGGPAPATEDVVERFLACARRSPEAPAVVDLNRGSTLTYGELAAQAAALAAELMRRGVGPEARVAVVLDRRLPAIVAMLAVLHAGGAFVPLDPAEPAPRLAAKLDDVAPRLILTRRRLLPRLPDGHRSAALCLDRQPPPPARTAPRHRRPAPAESAAYVIFTSGSSGRPRGVVIERRSLAWTAAANRARDALAPGDRLLPLAPLSFDLSIAELFPPLTAGGALTIDDAALADGARGLLRRCAGAGVTIIQPATGLWHELADAIAAEPALLPSCLRLVVIGTEPFSPAKLARWLRSAGDRPRLTNGYGLTESAVDATWRQLQRALPPPPAGTPIGRPLPGVRAAVYDRRLRPVAAGVPGELCLAGPGLARGYLGRPAATAARFLPDPRATRPGARLLATGDLARFAAGGDLICLGRRDQQVKIRGHRLEPAEVEAVLDRHPALTAAAVVASSAAGELQLVAHLVAAVQPPAAADLRRYLERRLPSWMVPARFVFHPRLPRTAHGKIDRRALAAQPLPRRREGAAGRPPRGPTERALAAIWRQLLGADEIAAGDDFFALGGHSLLALRLVGRIAREMGVELPVTALLERPTIARLAELVDGPRRQAGSSPLILVRAGDEEARPPFFCIPPAGRSVLCYAPLARRLEKAQAVYGLEARGADGRRPAEADLPHLAAAYRRAILDHRARGPYLLGGWCTGGVVAWELARQLAEDGRTVALLALLDSVAPPPAPPPPPALPEAANPVARVLLDLGRDLGLADGELAVILDGLIDVPAARTLRWLHSAEWHHGLSPGAIGTATWSRLFALLAAVPRRQRLARLGDAARRFGIRADDLEPARLRRLCRFYARINLAVRNYRPRPYGGRVVLLRTEPAATSDPTLGWHALAGAGIEVEYVPGDHLTLLKEPHVGALAAALGRRLTGRWVEGSLRTAGATA